MASQPKPGNFQHISCMGKMNNYETQPGAFYTPQQNPPPHTHYFNASPQFQSTVPQTNNQYNENFQKSVLDQLMSLDNRLTKLDSIEKKKHLSTLSTK